MVERAGAQIRWTGLVERHRVGRRRATLAGQRSMHVKRITPCLWFDRDGEEAARFYTSVFRDSRIKQIARYGDSAAAASGRPKGSVMTVVFEIQGQEFMALNASPPRMPPKNG